jgi:hypothetical protein
MDDTSLTDFIRSHCLIRMASNDCFSIYGVLNSMPYHCPKINFVNNMGRYSSS